MAVVACGLYQRPFQNKSAFFPERDRDPKVLVLAKPTRSRCKITKKPSDLLIVSGCDHIDEFCSSTTSRLSISSVIGSAAAK
ncbi:hypothetical protein [Bradyrhizobium sp. USDA 10063]